MSPLDPRHDSDPKQRAAEPPTVNLMETILTELRGLREGQARTDTRIDDVRAAQRDQAIALDRLNTSHGDHRSQIDQLRDRMVDLGQRVTQVEGKAEHASNVVVTNTRRISETQHAFDTTLASVNVATNKVAAAADTHTAQLVTLEHVNELQTSVLAKIQRWQPVYFTVALILAETVRLVLSSGRHP